MRRAVCRLMPVIRARWRIPAIGPAMWAARMPRMWLQGIPSASSLRMARSDRSSGHRTRGATRAASMSRSINTPWTERNRPVASTPWRAMRLASATLSGPSASASRRRTSRSDVSRRRWTSERVGRSPPGGCARAIRLPPALPKAEMRRCVTLRQALILLLHYVIGWMCGDPAATGLPKRRVHPVSFVLCYTNICSTTSSGTDSGIVSWGSSGTFRIRSPSKT